MGEDWQGELRVLSWGSQWEEVDFDRRKYEADQNRERGK